jgi:hypothetical protein
MPGVFLSGLSDYPGEENENSCAGEWQAVEGLEFA